MAYSSVQNTSILNAVLKTDIYEAAAALANSNIKESKQELKIRQDDLKKY